MDRCGLSTGLSYFRSVGNVATELGLAIAQEMSHDAGGRVYRLVSKVALGMGGKNESGGAGGYFVPRSEFFLQSSVATRQSLQWDIDYVAGAFARLVAIILRGIQGRVGPDVC